MEPAGIEALRARAVRGPGRYLEFLRVPTMSAGVYVLGAGAIDQQSPHTEDEIYYVVRGRAGFQQGDRNSVVRSGDALFVPAGEVHRFHDIEEELLLLVVFAPAERAP
ncbi:MAG: cupin domain-containing protein [Thermoplasmata archaeon]|nr:cupin domain-containing protein [Thermoplasmata archaeon]